MRLRIYRDFFFDAAHWLPNLPDGHKCKRLHGHTYRVRFTIEGDAGSEWVVDFAEIKESLEPWWSEVVDHHPLNSIHPNPTIENMTRWIYHKAKEKLVGLVQVEIQEGAHNGCIYSES